MEVCPDAEEWKHFFDVLHFGGVARRVYNWGIFVVQLVSQVSGPAPNTKSVS